jgi:hypothetical protein
MWRKTKVKRISRQPYPIRIDKEQLKVDCFNYLRSVITDVHVRLNLDLPWQMQHSARRFFSPADWTKR